MDNKISFEVTDEGLAGLKEMAEDCGLKDLRPLFEDMIWVYGHIIQERHLGRLIASVDEEAKVYAEFRTPILRSIKKLTPEEIIQKARRRTSQERAKKLGLRVLVKKKLPSPASTTE